LGKVNKISMWKINISHRDTVKKIKWLDFDNRIYDEEWHRVYTLFGIFKFNLTFKETNDLNIANYKLKGKEVDGFKQNKYRRNSTQ
jgi:hypothetical protein